MNILTNKKVTDKNRFSSLTQNWLISYVSILLLPILFCFLYGIHTYHSVKEQNIGILQKNLSQKAAMAEEYIENITSHYYTLYLNTSVQKIQSLTKALTPTEKYYLMQLQDEIQNLINTQSKLSNIIIYFPKVQIMVDKKTYCTYELATKMDAPPIEVSLIDDLLFSIKELNASKFTYYAKDNHLFLASWMHSTSFGEISSMIVFELKSQTLLDCLQTDIEGTSFMITNSSNVLFYQDEFLLDLLADMPKQLPEISQNSIQNKNHYLFAIASSCLEDFFYVYITEKNSYDHALTSIITFFLIIMLLSLLLGSLLITYFIKKNYQPVKEIITHINPKQSSFTNEYNIILDTLKSNSSELKRQQQILSNNYLMKMLNGEIMYEENTSNHSNFHPVISESHLCISLIELKDCSVNDKELYLFIIKNVLAERLSSSQYTIQFCMFSSRVAAIISCDAPQKQFMEDIHEQHRFLHDFIQKNSSISLTIGISDHWTSKERLHLAYAQAKETLEYTNFYQCNPVYLHSQLPELNSLTSINIYNTRDVISLISSENENELAQYFDNLYHKFCAQPTSLAEGKNLIYYYRQLLTELQHFLRSKYLADCPEYCNQTDETFFHLSLEEAASLTKEAFLNAKELISTHKSNHMLLLVQQVRTYINNNYFDVNMNQTTIANHFHITPAYLSQKFKDEYDTSIIQYLYSVRIEQSLKLLMEKKLKISEIAIIVGFSNTNSYIRVFKQFQGVSPGKYIELQE